MTDSVQRHCAPPWYMRPPWWLLGIFTQRGYQRGIAEIGNVAAESIDLCRAVSGYDVHGMLKPSINLSTSQGDTCDVAGIKLIKESAVRSWGWPTDDFNCAKDGE